MIHATLAPPWRFRNFLPLLAMAALFSAACQKPASVSANGDVASPNQLLAEIFDSLDDLEALDPIARRAESTPGVQGVRHDRRARALRIGFDPPIAASAIAALADWDDAFVVENTRNNSWFLAVFDRRAFHGGSYDEVSFTVPEHGGWQVIAVATRRPSGPPPAIGSGASHAYPLVDYPVDIDSVVIRPADRS